MMLKAGFSKTWCRQPIILRPFIQSNSKSFHYLPWKQVYPQKYMDGKCTDYRASHDVSYAKRLLSGIRISFLNQNVYSLGCTCTLKVMVHLDFFSTKLLLCKSHLSFECSLAANLWFVSAPGSCHLLLPCSIVIVIINFLFLSRILMISVLSYPFEHLSVLHSKQKVSFCRLGKKWIVCKTDKTFKWE